MKKKFLRVILVGLTLFLVYIGLKVYQSNQIEIIPLEDISDLHVPISEVLSEDTVITGKAAVGQFEAVVLADRIVVDDTLYLILYKWPSFISEDEIDISLGHVTGLSNVDRISIIWGDIYSGEGTARGYSYVDLVDHPDQELIWEYEVKLND